MVVSAYIYRYMYDEQVVDVFLLRGGGHLFNQTQNWDWDLVSLIRLYKGYAFNCIYSGNADGGFCNNCYHQYCVSCSRAI